MKDKNHNPGPQKLTDAVVDALKQKVVNDRRKTVHQLAVEIKLSCGSVHHALRKRLKLRKAWTTWVPHLLNAA